MILPPELWTLILGYSKNPNRVLVCKLWNELCGRPHIIKKYYPNGKLKLQYETLHGCPHGKSVSYYDDRAVHIIKNYHGGWLHGEYKKYDRSGDLIELNNFNKGILDGFAYRDGKWYRYNKGVILTKLGGIGLRYPKGRA